MPIPGFGQRLAKRIRAMKAGIYRDDAAKFGIKVTAFGLAYRYPPQHVYKWLGDVVVPDFATILRLARDVDASPGWLLFGDEAIARPKGARRQGRRTAGSLLLAWTLGGASASALGWPSGSAAAQPTALAVVQLLEKMYLIGRWLRRAGAPWARPMQPVGCPA